jgi:MarR family transcriptional regulator, organic hydroperoxide resistance regulator
MTSSKTRAANLRQIAASDFEYAPEESIGYLVRAAFRSLTPLLKAQIAGERVTIGMWYFLRVLWWRDGLSQRELTERVELMQPTAVTALRSMERRGLVSLEKDKSDKRRVRIFLTAEGRRLKRRLMPRVAEINNWVLKDVPAHEAEAFVRTLKRIQHNAVRAGQTLQSTRKPGVRLRKAG